MEYTRLGRTGLKVSRLCLGTMQFGWTADADTAFSVMDAFVEGGGNFLDTADIYSRWVEGNPGGVSETIVGQWLRERGNRRQMVVATKVRGRMWDGPNGEGLSRAHVLAAAEDSLRRLGTDAIDLYQTHWPDDDTPIDETLRALDDLVAAGKVRYIGCSNIPAWRLALALWAADRGGWARYETLQPHYNLVHRREYEAELMPLCADQALGVIPYSPLAGGFLTGTYRPSAPLPASARAESISRRYLTPARAPVLAALDRVAADHGASVAQVALAWLLAKPTVTSPIVGANSTRQLAELLPAVDVMLTDEERGLLDEASLPAAGADDAAD